MKALNALVATEGRLFLREPVAAFFCLVFPAVLMLVLGSAIPGFTEPSDDIGGKRPIDLYLPITLAMAIATVTMTSLLGVLATYRERGILRRLSTTPVSPVALLGAQLIVNMVALLAGSVLAYVVAAIAFGVPLPGSIGATVVAFLLGAAAMCAVALVIAAVTPNARVSAGIGTLVYFPMMFAAGVWTPGPMMAASVQRVADYTPLGAASQALQAAWAGAQPQTLHLVVMAVVTVACGAIAAKTFRWS